MDTIPTLPTGPAAISKSFSALIEQFLNAHDVKPITRDGYRRRLRQFFKWWESEKVSTANRETIINFKRHLVARKFTSYSISGYMVAVRQFFAWAESVKVHPNIARGIKGTRRQKGFCRDAFTEEQVQTILNSIDTTTLVGKRDFALINLPVSFRIVVVWT